MVEAQDATGTLLGFERTRELSRQAAAQIARAAQQYGQKDDITVIGVEFLGLTHIGVSGAAMNTSTPVKSVATMPA